MLVPKKLIFLSFISLLAVSCGYHYHIPHHTITISEEGFAEVSRKHHHPPTSIHPITISVYSVYVNFKDQDPIKEELRQGATATLTSLKTKKTLPLVYTRSQLRTTINDICETMGSGEQSFSIKISKGQKVLREKTYTVNIHNRCS